MRINAESNASDIAQRIRALGSQALFAAAVSLTRAAKDAQDAERKEMMRAFDRPTAYALNGTFLKAATKQNLEARIWVKDAAGGRGTPADRFLLPEIYGGKRGQKGMERMLQRAGLLPAGWFAVPAAGAQLDGNGNVKRSQVNQILAQLQVQRTAGHESRRSNSGAARRSSATYIALTTATRGLKPGIYLKRKGAGGAAIQPVFIFVSKVQYRPRFKFTEVGEKVGMERFNVHFETEITKAFATARLGGQR